MPVTVSSYHFRLPDVAAIRAVAARLVRGQAWVSPISNGWVSLYDAYLDRPDLHEMMRVAQVASADLGCVVMGVVADEGQMAYALYDRGQEKDVHVAEPERFSEPWSGDRVRGKAEVLLQYSQEPVALEALEAVLHGGAMPGSGMTAEQFEAVRRKVQERLPQALGTPEAVQKMLAQAAEQIKFMPTGMLESFFRSMGLPANHPALLALRANPAEFIRQMALDSDAVSRFSQQIASGFQGENMPNLKPGPIEKAVVVTRVLGIPAEHVLTTYPTVAGAPPAGFLTVNR